MYKINVLVSLLVLVIGFGCTHIDNTAHVPGSNTQQLAHTKETIAWDMIHNGALILDVRTKREYDQGHLENALFIPHSVLADNLAQLGADKNKPIVTYCAAGGRAGIAKTLLEDYGFTHVHNGGGYKQLMQTK